MNGNSLIPTRPRRRNIPRGRGPRPNEGRPRGEGGFSIGFSLRNFAIATLLRGFRVRTPRPGGQLNALPGQAPTGPSSTNPFPAGSGKPPFAKFPKGFAANDPIFDIISKSKSVFKKIPVLGRVIDIADVLVGVAEGIQLESMADILRRQEIELADIAAAAIKRKQDRDRAARADLAATKLEQAPESIPDFDESLRPAPSPRIEPVPSFPARSPVTTPAGLPIPRTIPVPSIDPPQLPRVDTQPVPTSRPAPQRSRLPDIDLGSNPLIDRLLSQTPQEINLTSVQSTVPSSPVPRTGSQFGTLTLPSQQPQLNLAARQCPARQCEDDRDNPRTECFKGLYKENLTSTDFIAWQEINCLTGQEI